MKIEKFIKNKDITITNDDIDIDALATELRKGYELSSDVESKIKSAVDEANKTSKAEFDALHSKYDDIEKRNTDLADRNKTLSLENVMTREGFKEVDFKDISSMRYSMFADEQDDVKAISSIKEKFKDTYFPAPPTEPPKEKDDKPLSNGSVKPQEPIVNRLTRIKDIMK